MIYRLLFFIFYKIIAYILTLHNSIVVICISRPRNHSLTYREKNCRRGHLRPRQDNLEDVKGLRGQHFLRNRKFEITYYKMNK
jgi:hypothetical protein